MDAPPCIRHLPFLIAGPTQDVPSRVFAPQRGVFDKLPDGFPFLRASRCVSSLVSRVLTMVCLFCWSFSNADRTDDSPTAFMNMDVFHGDSLLTHLTSQPRHRLKLFTEQTHEPHGPKHVCVTCLDILFICGGIPEEHQCRIVNARLLNSSLGLYPCEVNGRRGWTRTSEPPA